jgi:glycosyltransferase involved in cell wall biosynthesis
MYKAPYAIVNILEELVSAKADLVIVVAERMLTSMMRFGANDSEVVMSCMPKDLISELVYRSDEKSGRRISNFLTVGYMGNIGRTFGEILKIVDHDTRIIMTGLEIDASILRRIRNMFNAQYVGFLPYTDYLLLIKNEVDVVLALYDMNIPKNELIYPNKLWESMALGKPIITNVARDIINETHCGIEVKFNLEEVRKAIEVFRMNPKAMTELGENGRRCFETKYNWEVMKARFIQAYNRLKLPEV